MASYPYLVQIAWDIVEKFVKDWQQEPYRWQYEADVQAELYSRLRRVYQAVGYGTEMTSGYTYDRVNCEHTVYYRYKDGQKYGCRPDLIVWDYENFPLSPKNDEWPILWVSEVKFEEERKNRKKDNWDDIKKLRYLLKSGAQYGCWLNFSYRAAASGNGIKWVKQGKNQSLWSCEITIP